MMDRVLWEKTGHWDNYKDAMFTTSSENREYCIKPMNCRSRIFTTGAEVLSRSAAAYGRVW